MKYLLIIILFGSFGCSQKKVKQNNTNIQTYDEWSEITEKVKSQIIKDNTLWIESWKTIDSTFDLDDFNLEFKKTFEVDWATIFNKNGFSPIDSMWVKSSFNLIADLFTYNTVIENRRGKNFFSFGVDQKIYIINEANRKIADLVTLGTVESIEDALWLNDGKRLLMLGYVQSEEVINPFLWLFDFERMEQFRYLNKSVSLKERNHFLKLKYPAIEIE